jgi:predicted PurR-regulated permease PerM
MNARPRPNSALFTLVALVTAIAALHFAREILLPIALATFVSFLLAPLADRLERWSLGRIPSVLAVVTVAFAVLGLLGWVVTSQLIDLSTQLPQYRENIVAKVRSITQGSDTLKGVTDTIEDVTKEITSDDADAEEETATSADAVVESANSGGVSPDAAETPVGRDERQAAWAWAERMFGDGDFSPSHNEVVSVKVVSMPPSPLAQMRGWLGPLMAPLTAAGIVVVLVLFMLLQREDQRNRLIRLFGAANIHATTEALTDVVNRVSRYLRMQFLINAGYGLCVGAGLAVLGLPNAVMFGVLSFSLRFLPYIGPWISAILPVAVSIAISPGWTQAALVVGWFVLLELIVNNVAEPLLYGSSIGVSGVGVILAAIFWTWIWGPVGLVLAMPLTVCLVVMARYVPALRFITVMLGDQPTLATEERIYQRMLALDDDEIRVLAEEFLDDAPLVDYYDRVLIPALRLAERDRHAGLLSEEQQRAIQELAREQIEELGVPGAGTEGLSGEIEPADATGSRARVMCVPLRDEADKTAALILGRLLEAERMTPLVGSVESLTSETVEAVESLDVDMVIVSVLPPLSVRTSRLLCRKLRKRYPQLPILVGYWDGTLEQEPHQLLAARGDGEIVTTLAAAVERARAIASRTPATAAELPEEGNSDERAWSAAGLET